jgi:hypothetical protein
VVRGVDRGGQVLAEERLALRAAGRVHASGPGGRDDDQRRPQPSCGDLPRREFRQALPQDRLARGGEDQHDGKPLRLVTRVLPGQVDVDEAGHPGPRAAQPEDAQAPVTGRQPAGERVLRRHGRSGPRVARPRHWGLLGDVHGARVRAEQVLPGRVELHVGVDQGQQPEQEQRLAAGQQPRPRGRLPEAATGTARQQPDTDHHRDQRDDE